MGLKKNNLNLSICSAMLIIQGAWGAPKDSKSTAPIGVETFVNRLLYKQSEGKSDGSFHPGDIYKRFSSQEKKDAAKLFAKRLLNSSGKTPELQSFWDLHYSVGYLFEIPPDILSELKENGLAHQNPLVRGAATTILAKHNVPGLKTLFEKRLNEESNDDVYGETAKAYVKTAGLDAPLKPLLSAYDKAPDSPERKADIL